DENVFKLWKMIYEPTVYFVGKTDDLYVDDYIKLIKEIFPPNESVDKYSDQGRLSEFIDRAIKLRGADIMRKINLKTIKIYFLVLFLLFFLVSSSVFSAENKKDLYSLEDISFCL
ncbi:unnamed protein product, partial [marine sediment metagenome]